MKNGVKRYLRFNVVAAVILATVGLLANVWSLGSLFAPLVKNGKMVFETKALIWAFQIFCVISSALLYFKGNTPPQRRRLIFGYITAAIMVLSVEVVLGLFARVLDMDGKEPAVDKLLSLSAYKDKDWAETLFRETEEYSAGREFEQFLAWTRKSYSGKYVNSDAQGARKTWNPSVVDDSRAKTVYVFGGSTMFGWWARDDYTIASHVSRLLNKEAQEYLVHNYGQPGYTFMQEVMKLILLLREGHRPDYVVFYDGVNDVYGAYQSGKAGTFQNILLIKDKLERKGPTSLQHFLLAAKGTLVKHSMIYRALKKTPSIFVKEPEFKETAARYSPEQLHTLAEDIADHYAISMDLLDGLSAAYGFKYLCFWQPVIYTEKKLLPEESDPYYHPRIEDGNLEAIYINIINMLEARKLENFHNIYDALAARTEPVYSDVYHLSERGNEIVAAKIAEIFKCQFGGQE